jgi:hypothetical protein
MSKKISHPYPHVGVTLSPHVDRARPYPLLLSLSLSLSLSRRSGSLWSARWPSSLRWPFLHHHGEERMGSGSSTKVAICFFAVGVSSHLRQVGPSHLLRHLLRHRPLGHLHRRHHHVQVSSPLLGRRPLSLPPLISVLV